MESSEAHSGPTFLKAAHTPLTITVGLTFMMSGVCVVCRYGRPEATDEEVIEAAKLASLHEAVVAMPGQYNSAGEYYPKELGFKSSLYHRILGLPVAVAMKRTPKISSLRLACHRYRRMT
eukprot:90331-Pelagomonas_calceolata.AAC.2